MQPIGSRLGVRCAEQIRNRTQICLSRYLVFRALQKIRQLEHRLRARCDVEFRQYVCNVMFDCVFRIDSNPLCYCGVPQALAQ